MRFDRIRQPDPLGLGNDLELDQKVGDVHVGAGRVSTMPMAPSAEWRADVDHRPRKALIRHGRHREEELAIEIARFVFGGSGQLQGHVLDSSMADPAIFVPITGTWMAAPGWSP